MEASHLLDDLGLLLERGVEELPAVLDAIVSGPLGEDASVRDCHAVAKLDVGTLTLSDPPDGQVLVELLLELSGALLLLLPRDLPLPARTSAGVVDLWVSSYWRRERCYRELRT